MKLLLDKFGSFGTVAAAAARPVCFPKLAVVGAFFGLGGLAAGMDRVYAGCSSVLERRRHSHTASQPDFGKSRA